MADGGHADDGKTCKTGKQSTVNGKRENQGKGKTVFCLGSKTKKVLLNFSVISVVKKALGLAFVYSAFGHPSSVFGLKKTRRTSNG
ncbi:MAG: hypothetical protein U9R40_02925 [Synergistota bacterium]|nr:hypothetical protein [Synergistota bacterium]